MAERIHCDICGVAVPTHGHYIVKMDVYADPSMPPVDTEDLEEIDPGEQMAKLIHEMQHMSADELQDQVHRRFEYRICAGCQKDFLANPLGKPRQMSRVVN